MLLGKSLNAGWRVSVRVADAAALPELDAALWLGPQEDFLPHAIAGGPHDADQPILLQADDDLRNAPSCIMSVGGAAITSKEVNDLERVCILFDGRDESAVAHARTQWKSLTGAGASAQYWSEESGRWEKKAEA